MNEQTPLELELHGYVDGALDDEAMLAIEPYLEREPRVAAKVRDYLMQKAHIRAFGESADLPAAPPAIAALEKELVKRLRPPRRLSWPRLALAAMLIAAGWIGHSLYIPLVSAPAYTAEVINAHILAATSPLQLTPVSPERIASMFAQIGERDNLPDLGTLGFQPVAAQLVPTDEGFVVQVIYRDAAGVMLSYFVLHDDEGGHDTPHEILRRNDVTLVYWQHDHSRYALAAPLAVDRLEQIAKLVELDQQI